MKKVRTVHNQPLDALVWQHYGETAGPLEAVLRANPGLAAYGPTPPAGLVIVLPVYTAPKPDPGVRLWD